MVQPNEAAEEPSAKHERVSSYGVNYFLDDMERDLSLFNGESNLV